MKKLYLRPEIEIDSSILDYNIITMSGGEPGSFDDDFQEDTLD